MIEAQELESVSLDYKASEALTNARAADELAKDVGAMANSAGGTLIYGVVEEDHKPVGIDGGLVPGRPSKEWIEHTIRGGLQRRVDGIRIVPVPLDTAAPGHYAYVVLVPQSSRRPHQSRGGRYYKRYNFESVPMEEYEVRDMYARRERPELEVEFEITRFTRDFDPGGRLNGVMDLVPVVTNDSPEPAEYARFMVYVDTGLEIRAQPRLDDKGQLAFNVGGEDRLFQAYSIYWNVGDGLPLMDETRFALIRSPITAAYQARRMNEEPSYVLGWEAKAPRAPLKRRFVRVTATASEPRLEPLEG